VRCMVLGVVGKRVSSGYVSREDRQEGDCGKSCCLPARHVTPYKANKLLAMMAAATVI